MSWLTKLGFIILRSTTILGQVAAKNIAPVARVSGTVDHGLLPRTTLEDDVEVQAAIGSRVSPDHIFHANYEAQFSWDDAEFQAMLVCCPISWRWYPMGP